MEDDVTSTQEENTTNNNNNNNNNNNSRGGSRLASNLGLKGPSRSISHLNTKDQQSKDNLAKKQQEEQKENERLAKETQDILDDQARRAKGQLDQEEDDGNIYIWGTSLIAKDIQKEFRDYITNFKLTKKKRQSYHNRNNNNNNNEDDSDIDMDGPQDKDDDHMDNIDDQTPLYLTLFGKLRDTAGAHLNINLNYLRSFNPKLCRQWSKYPTEILPLLEKELNDIYMEFLEDTYQDENHPDYQDPQDFPTIEIHPFNLGTNTPMRELNPTDINQLISIRGLIIRTSSVIPDLREALFQCTVCNTEARSELVKGKIIEPAACPNQNCKAKQAMMLVHNLCTFGDKQYIKLQETPDAIPEGETPHTVALFVYGDMIDVGKPGDRVEVTGVFKANPMKASATTKTLRSIYKTYIDVLHIKKTEKGDFIVDSENADLMFDDIHDVEISDERITEIESLAKRGDIYDLITKSLAPSIWEMDDVKKGILCQLFGGSDKNKGNTGTGGRFRGDINILLCGDPGTSKSQMLSYVHKIAPRGIYTSGKGSSAVGLTAYITRDPDTRETVLESGALVLSDQGVCCIDEFDKMSDQTRSILHEVMEQQTVSVAKADEAVEGLVEGYLEMRSKGDGKRTITATPRQLESLIRLSEAHAKIRLSEIVEPLDVQEAIRLVRVALHQAAIDPTTGTIDMDLITTGRSASNRLELKELKEFILEVVNARNTTYDTLQKLFLLDPNQQQSQPSQQQQYQHQQNQQQLNPNQRFTNEDIKEALKQLISEEQIRNEGGSIGHMVYKKY
ncbi:MCM family protein [Cavenderia fasciculata]|uniref:DNA replication licensing factor MCM4 n=1 Tax=Cavenderia fasciculata TaxID=261658 RepID=F4Q6N6_CACFS|nr:MCM family protein [Cavenderia fasciculata]EGG16546.1 MCM family protein [Cavenderia fasciculata]|eukprot:XP_004354946.1 MCM family protein [Cavenderia fasciculata]